MGRPTLALALLGALALPAGAQIASSPNFQLDGLSLDATAGGASSANSLAQSQLGPLESGAMASANFQLEIGFGAIFDPDPGDRPLIFGMAPRHADKAGGEAVSIHGRNLGLGLAPEIKIDGVVVPETEVSDTLPTTVSPAGDAGKVNVRVTHADGTFNAKDSFVFSPAIDTAEIVYQDGLWPLRFYGAVGDTFQTWMGFFLFVPPLNTNFGPLHIQPPLINIIPSLPYFGPSGIVEIVLRTPIDPALEGVSFYLQNLDVDASDPPPKLTNLTAVTFQ